MDALELWASPEPTVARLDALTVRDQLTETGHDARLGDAELIAALGVNASRVPVLWERVAPEGPDEFDFRESAARVRALQRLGVEPIVTLLHHGSGPRYTDLLDPSFPGLFAAFAAAAARALPDVRRWTPINEPLTTARFSTLYGVWYPNMRDDRAFGRALVHETLAQQAAMRCIRALVPDAQFVMTEDLQRFAARDAAVEPYVAFLRERAMLSIELVAGRVDARHPLAAFLRERCGLGTRDLRAMQRGATVPDLVAFNHYPHSERYCFTGEDGTIGDVPAVYVAGEPSPRAAPLLRAAAARLAVPVALGEVHVHAPAGERVRWLAEHLADARALRAEGVDVRAVGAWAAFGMIDWHSLLRKRDRVIEDGIYTFAGPNGIPEATPVADALRVVARSGTIVQGERGWWERPERVRSRTDLLAMRDAGIPEGNHVRIVDEAFA